MDRLVGQVVEVDEVDYAYGIGLLRMRVQRVTPMRSEPGWAMIHAVRVDVRGSEHETCTVAVRLAAIRAAPTS